MFTQIDLSDKNAKALADFDSNERDLIVHHSSDNYRNHIKTEKENNYVLDVFIFRHLNVVVTLGNNPNFDKCNVVHMVYGVNSEIEEFEKYMDEAVIRGLE